MAQGCCKRYSLGHEISNPPHETPESLDINTPRLLAAKNSPEAFGFEASYRFCWFGKTLGNHHPLFAIIGSSVYHGFRVYKSLGVIDDRNTIE
jgi:hypothetical protein